MIAEDHVKAGRPREAIAALEKAISFDEKARPRLTLRLAGMYNDIAWDAFVGVTLEGKRTEGLKDALADVEKALAFAPNNKTILDTRGHVHLALGNTDGALADFNKAITLGANRCPAVAGPHSGALRLQTAENETVVIVPVRAWPKTTPRAMSKQ